jgi:hypothetical protein
VRYDIYSIYDIRRQRVKLEDTARWQTNLPVSRVAARCHGGSVGIATEQRAGGSGSNTGNGKRFCSSSKRPDRLPASY